MNAYHQPINSSEAWCSRHLPRVTFLHNLSSSWHFTSARLDHKWRESKRGGWGEKFILTKELTYESNSILSDVHLKIQLQQYNLRLTDLTGMNAEIWKCPSVTDSNEASPLIKEWFGHYKTGERVLYVTHFEYVCGISITSPCQKHFFLRSIWFLDKWGSSELVESVNATVSSLLDVCFPIYCMYRQWKRGITQNVWAIFVGLSLHSYLKIQVSRKSHHGSMSYFVITTPST